MRCYDIRYEIRWKCCKRLDFLALSHLPGIRETQDSNAVWPHSLVSCHYHWYRNRWTKMFKERARWALVRARRKTSTLWLRGWDTGSTVSQYYNAKLWLTTCSCPNITQCTLFKYYSLHFVSSACKKWRKVASCGKCLLHTAGHLAGDRKVGSGKYRI